MKRVNKFAFFLSPYGVISPHLFTLLFLEEPIIVLQLEPFTSLFRGAREGLERSCDRTAGLSLLYKPFFTELSI